MDIKNLIENLISYSKQKLSLKTDDENLIRNSLLAEFKLNSPELPTEFNGDLQTDILDPIIEYAIKNKLCKKEDALRYETKILGIVTPMPSAVIAQFDCLCMRKNTVTATDWFFNLSVDNNYIRMIDINKNIIWDYTGPLGNIRVTINLSKPEKDPKQIALMKTQAQTNYPKCLLCPSNVGFEGTLTHPARQTLRIIPIHLNNENWEFQFSPYQYYDQHLIALADEHRPMNVDRNCFVRLLNFVEMFKHYFLGSNAALPIVGGSILTHDHYQGGKKVLPMFLAKERNSYESNTFKKCSISTLDWYNSVIRIRSKNIDDVVNCADYVLKQWQDYSDESVNIINFSDGEPHNAVTPIAHFEEGEFVLDMILRNNRTDEKHPYGIFHPTEDLHNIKKEGIGLIEAMGTFILPGRLEKEFKLISAYLTGERKIGKELADPENPLYKHGAMIMQLCNDYGVNNTEDEAFDAITKYVNITCEKILECTAV
ncbi:MAG: UDP-glucose--hexose-1-phosphate uridylyltransferase, partial [Clostridia bacterium]